VCERRTDTEWVAEEIQAVAFRVGVGAERVNKSETQFGIV
jgi:hypothetical protein